MKHDLGVHSVAIRRRITQVDVTGGKVVASASISEESGYRAARLELCVDLDRLAKRLAARALLSKGRMSTAQGGAIVVRVVKGTEIGEVIEHSHNPRCYRNGELICDKRYVPLG